MYIQSVFFNPNRHDDPYDLFIRKQNCEQHIQSDVTEMEADGVSVQDDSGMNNLKVSQIQSDYSSNE